MPNTIFITIDGKDTEVDEANLRFTRKMDDRGRPSERLQPPVFVVKRDPLQNLGAVAKWLIDQPDTGKEITITIYDDESKEKVIDTIELKNASVVQYRLGYLQTGGDKLMEEFQITAEQIKISDAEYDAKWPKVD